MKVHPLNPEQIEKLMRRAIQMALKAQYQTEPNPVVGAILVDARGRILSEGFHEKAGMPHAEVVTLKPFETVPEDATLFVTLEPCNHHGKTPPCTDLILSKKVRHVVVGCQDPNPKVSGKGIEKLRANGVHITTGVCESECREINRVFNKHIVQKIPYVTIKAAFTLDGKIAMPSGESQWITGEMARAKGHSLRSQHQAIAVGRQTLVHDNPGLTDRASDNPRQPVRVVYASRGEIPADSQFLNDRQTRRIVIAGNSIVSDTEKRLVREGVEMLIGPEARPSITWGLKRLYESGICSVLVEGGGQLIASIIRENAADQLYLFLAGKIIGSSTAPSWTGELGFEKLTEVPRLSIHQVERVGDDLMLNCFFTDQ